MRKLLMLAKNWDNWVKMTQKEIEAELKRLLEQEADHPDCLHIGGTSYPISTARLPTSAAMPLKSIMKSLEKELNQDFFPSNNLIIPKKKTIKKRSSFINYSLTKIKARNFLTNISYSRVKEEDFNNRSFIIDCYSFVILYLSPFYLDWKFENSVEKDYVEVLWQQQIPNDFFVLSAGLKIIRF